MHVRRRQLIHLLLTVVFLVSFAASASATGVIDPTFGSGGRAASGWSGSRTFAGKIFIQSDDKIIVAGSTVAGVFKIAVARYNAADGSLDNSFAGGSGISTVGVTAAMGDAVLQPDGKIVVVGSTDFSFSTNNQSYIIARLTVSGSLDQTFGNGGQVVIDRNPQSPAPNFLYSVAVQPDGKILAAGQRGQAVGEILRLNSDGTIDATFGNAGYVSFDAPNFNRIQTLAVAADNKILASGTSSPDNAMIFRLNADGATDASFGQNGFVQLNGELSDLVVQPDGKIIASGNQIRRFLPDGALDSGFKVSNNGGEIKLLSDGRLLTTNGGERINLLAADGRLIGKADKPTTTNTADTNVRFSDVETQSNGKIVAPVNFTRPHPTMPNTFNTDFFTIRYNSITSLGNRAVNFDSDERTEIGVFRPSNNSFIIQVGTTSQSALILNADKPVRRPIPESFHNAFQSSLVWSSTNQSLNNFCSSQGDNLPSTCFQWGLSTDNPIGGDYDGDNLTDYTVVRDGVWHILQSSTQTHRAVLWGYGTDKPVPADYDADGKTDVAVYRPSNGTWYALRSSEHFTFFNFGAATDLPVPADYDGDGRADIAVFRPSNGVWYLLQSTGGLTALAFGASDDKPVPGDYDGDGKTDIAVFRPSNAVWYLQQSRDGFGAVQWGQSGDIPLSTIYSAY